MMSPFSTQFPAHFSYPLSLRLWFSPQNSVLVWAGIAQAAQGLDGPGIERLWGPDFSHPSKPAVKPTQPPTQWIPGHSQG